MTLVDSLVRAARSSAGVYFVARSGTDAFHSYAEIYERARSVAGGL